MWTETQRYIGIGCFDVAIVAIAAVVVVVVGGGDADVFGVQFSTVLLVCTVEVDSVFIFTFVCWLILCVVCGDLSVYCS